MTIEIINGQRVERADEGKWLYEDREEGVRYFTVIVYLGRNAEPWAECTDAEKTAWEEEHTEEQI